METTQVKSGTELNTELLRTYSDVCKKIKELETEKEMIQQMVMQHLNESKTEKVISPFGTFSIGERKIYKYTDEVAIAKEEMQIIMKEEEENGKAIASITKFVRYQSPKA